MWYIVSTNIGNTFPAFPARLLGCCGAMEIRLHDEKYYAYDLYLWNFIRNFALYKSVTCDTFVKWAVGECAVISGFSLYKSVTSDKKNKMVW